MKKLVFIACIFYSVCSHAEIEVSPITTVSQVFSFSEYGGGDVTVKLENNGPACTDGYWLKKDDPGFQANLSMILSAYHSGSTIQLRGHTEQVWPGSSGTYCHLYLVNLKKS